MVIRKTTQTILESAERLDHTFKDERDGRERVYRPVTLENIWGKRMLFVVYLNGEEEIKTGYIPLSDAIKHKYVRRYSRHQTK